jgi:predicted transcriptional regulator of viral defense system
MVASQRDLSQAGQAARALARAGLSVVRVPEDLGALTEHGLPGGSRGIEPLVKLGLLRPVARGIYEVRDSRGVALSSFELLLAARFCDRPHLVTGWWALSVAGLTSQDVREALVLTTTKRRDLHALGRRAHVVRVAATDLWGGKRRRSGLVIASPARALCDCARRPSSRIPATRLAEAVDAYLHDDVAAASASLAAAVRRFASPAAARRLGYLVELTAGEAAAAPFRGMLGASHKADALDHGDEDAPIITRWRVRTRLDADQLLEHRHVS